MVKSVKRITFEVSPELHRELKIKAAELEVDYRIVILDSLAVAFPEWTQLVEAEVDKH